MDVSVLTAFPGLFEGFVREGLVGKARAEGLMSLEIRDLREWGKGAYRAIDDYSFGGRGGMTITAPVLAAALDAVARPERRPYVIYPSPQGIPLTQDLVESLPRDRQLVVICGHYEGLDERFVSSRVDLEISLGDFVLSGGELPAMVLVDALVRLVPGAVGKELSVERDSFFDGMLDTCHYTRPAQWEGQDVPGVLTSGNEAAIERWRRRTALSRTLARRPDLLSRASLIGYMAGDVHLGLVVEPTDPSMAALVDDCLAMADVYGLGRVFIAPASGSADDLRAALGERAAKIVSSPGRMIDWVVRKGRGIPTVLTTQVPEGLPWLEAKRRMALVEGPVIVLFGTKRWNGAETIPLRPLEATGRALPLVALVSATLDRFFGSR